MELILNISDCASEVFQIGGNPEAAKDANIIK